MTARLLVTGAGAGPAENLIRSLRAGDVPLAITGCHHDRFALKNSTADAKYLIPAAEQRGFARALRRVVARETIDLIVPTSDADVRAVARGRRALPCRVFLPRARVIELCRDKYRLNVLLRSRGVAAPLTYPVRSLAGLDALFRRLQPATTVWCRIRTGHGALGALAVKTPAQARAWIDYWVRMRGVRADAFTLSEYLPGRDFSCQSLWHEGTLVLTKTFERVTPFGGQPGAASVAALARTVREPRVADVCAAAVRAVDRRASGVFCFDVRENVRGAPCVTEINAGRFSMSTNLYDLVGKHNMAVTHVRLALGEPVDIRDEYDVSEGYYMVRDLDTLAGIFHADEFFEGIEDVRP
jgi:carbamoyl-phosphate synthase large subunit